MSIYIDPSNISCGACQIGDISSYNDPKMALKDAIRVIKRYNNFNSAFILYSDRTSRSIAAALAKEIIDRGLGKITFSDAANNPNTNNSIRVYIWELNRARAHQFYERELNIESKKPTLTDKVRLWFWLRKMAITNRMHKPLLPAF